MGRFPAFQLPDKRCPVPVLTRDEVIDDLNEIIVAPVTRTIRGMRTEVILTEEDGMHATCTVYFDHTSLGQRDGFGAVSRSLSADAAEFGRTLVREWAMIHQEELREDWELCRTNAVPAKIQPLA